MGLCNGRVRVRFYSEEAKELSNVSSFSVLLYFAKAGLRIFFWWPWGVHVGVAGVWVLGWLFTQLITGICLYASVGWFLWRCTGGVRREGQSTHVTGSRVNATNQYYGAREGSYMSPRCQSTQPTCSTDNP